MMIFSEIKKGGAMMGFLDNLEAWLDFEEDIDKDSNVEDENG